LQLATCNLQLLLHGDNQTQSRNELTSIVVQAKKDKKEIIRFTGKDLTLESLTQALEGQSLFGQDRLVVIEEFLSQPKSKRKEEVIAYLTSLASSTPVLSQDTTPGVGCPKIDLVFWEKKTLTPAVLRKLPFIQKTKVFKIPRLVFKLVESLSPGNQKQSLSLLYQLLKNGSVELAFYMIARQIRLLIQAKDNVLPKMAPWMLGKLKSQAAKFKSTNQLINLHQQLLEIDRAIKTGATPMDLAWHLDIFIVNNLD